MLCLCCWACGRHSERNESPKIRSLAQTHAGTLPTGSAPGRQVLLYPGIVVRCQCPVNPINASSCRTLAVWHFRAKCSRPGKASNSPHPCSPLPHTTAVAVAEQRAIGNPSQLLKT